MSATTISIAAVLDILQREEDQLRTEEQQHRRSRADYERNGHRGSVKEMDKLLHSNTCQRATVSHVRGAVLAMAGETIEAEQLEIGTKWIGRHRDRYRLEAMKGDIVELRTESGFNLSMSREVFLASYERAPETTTAPRPTRWPQVGDVWTWTTLEEGPVVEVIEIGSGRVSFRFHKNDKESSVPVAAFIGNYSLLTGATP